MNYPGVKKEDQRKMSKCVANVRADGKTESQAIELCKLSINNQVVPEEKEKPWKTIESKDFEEMEELSKCLFFSSSDFEKTGKKINASKSGKVIKGIEVFKAGTYRGIEFKKSALDKMVANFHYLKGMGIFPNVPVRADHPAPFGIGGTIDKVGGYVKDLRREGKKLVADIRVTSESMWDKIHDGSYINRSAEIGNYDDNEGVMYSPVFYGFAWVDIPQVEKLSPNFTYSKNGHSIITLNSLEIMPKKDKFPTEELEKETTEEEVTEEPTKEVLGEPVVEKEVVEEEKVEEKIEEAKEITKEEDTKEELSKDVEAGYREKYQGVILENFVKEGKIVPANLATELEFAKGLSAEQFEKYVEIKKNSPQLVELEKEQVDTSGEQVIPSAKKVDEKDEATIESEKFLEETK